MTLTNTEAVTDLSILEALDFDATLACDGMRRNGPTEDDFYCPFDAEADLLIRVHVSGNHYFVCRDCWAERDTRLGWCPHTGLNEYRDEHMTIVRELK